jgi:sugar phosphate isomerase/epimerase
MEFPAMQDLAVFPGDRMTNAMHRRDFLKAAGLTAASLSVGATTLQGQTPELIKNSPGHPRLLSGCCAYSYRKYLQNGPMTMEEFILKAVELEIDGVDMTTYYLKSTEPSYILGLRRLAFRNGVPFSGAAIGTDMCQPDPTKRAEEIEKIKKWLAVTEMLGASHLRVFGGAIPAAKGITLGIESHGGITSKAVNITEILRRVDSPYAGCNLDISNFPEDPYTQIEACIPYATHTHIRDFYGEPRKPLDLERVWQLFAQGGYKGFTSAEYEGDEDAKTGVPKLLARIKALNKKYSTV